jgi:hypothetical protein
MKVQVVVGARTLAPDAANAPKGQFAGHGELSCAAPSGRSEALCHTMHNLIEAAR